MAGKKSEDAKRKRLKKLFSAIMAVYDQLFMEVAVEMVQHELEPGGRIYEKVMAAAIAGAASWYGMYTPKVYKRGMTLTDRSNIVISGEVSSVSKDEIEITGSIENVSPHIGYTAGFIMRNGEERPGGDVMAFVKSEVFETRIVVPPNVVKRCLKQAVDMVLGS